MAESKLIDLQGVLREFAAELGFPPGLRHFQPHLHTPAFPTPVDRKPDKKEEGGFNALWRSGDIATYVSEHRQQIIDEISVASLPYYTRLFNELQDLEDEVDAEKVGVVDAEDNLDKAWESGRSMGWRQFLTDPVRQWQIASSRLDSAERRYRSRLREEYDHEHWHCHEHWRCNITSDTQEFTEARAALQRLREAVTEPVYPLRVVLEKLEKIVSARVEKLQLNIGQADKHLFDPSGQAADLSAWARIARLKSRLAQSESARDDAIHAIASLPVSNRSRHGQQRPTVPKEPN